MTTRRLAELRAEADAAGVSWTEDMSRGALFDALREALGGYDAGLEVDPAKCKDLKTKIAWGTDAPFAAISSYLTEAYVAEPKLDGCRMRLYLGGSSNTINSGRRSVKTFRYSVRTDNFPHLRDAVVPALNGVILDGEIMAPHPVIQTHTGNWTNSLLNASVSLCNSGPVGAVATQERFGRAQYHVFDILAGPGGESVQDLPYDARRALLEDVVKQVRDAYPDVTISLVPQLPATVETINKAIADGYEGVVLKKRDSIYVPGKRLPTWLKVKTMSTADAFVIGFTPGENKHTGLVGSLNLAVAVREATLAMVVLGAEEMIFDIEGAPWVVRGVAQVGNLTDEYRQSITAADGGLKPEILGTVVEFMAQGIGKNGRARHAHLVRLRPDKTPVDCGPDQMDVFPKV